MGGFDDGRMPGVQQYDVGSRVFVCRLWERPDVPYVMAENAMASTVFDWRGAPPSNEYKQQIVDRSTVRVVVPAEAMKRSGPVDMQLTIRQNGTEERSPILCFPVWKSLLAGEQNYPEPVRVLDELINRTNKTAERVEQLQIDASGLAGDALKLGGKPPEAYAAVNLLDNSNFEIAQAGYGGLHGNTKYAADRWTLSGGTAVWNGSNIVISSEADGQQVNMVQKLADGTYKKGTVYTFAVMLADGTLGIVHGDFITNAYANIYDTEGKRVALGIQSDNVVIPVYSTGAHGIAWAALYEGEYNADTLPPYVPKGYAVELAECQRYGIPLTNQPAYGYVWGSGGLYMTIPIPTKLRITPSLGGTLKMNIVHNGMQVAVTNFVVASIGTGTLELKVDAGDHSLGSTPAIVTGYISQADYASADL